MEFVECHSKQLFILNVTETNYLKIVAGINDMCRMSQ